ncbi:hypothetical protein LZV00_24775 [Pseudomonas kielensis]|uniref:hypothetical protein n=1 Tax=Pseudomonas kielensis TaxID=2762577 RepID=UPI00223FBFCF|nr:hypothetical protein [Pseudomonas kielensis]UZM13795.1 hypothetical protein LZV00_24775 [Pseudomonas kielensis]
MAIYTFDSEQRCTLDRYTLFLSTIVSTHDKVNLVFFRRASSGHQPTSLSYDSRLNNVVWDERNLHGLWARVKALRDQASAYIEALVTFKQEVLLFIARTSKSELLDGMDISNFSLAHSPIWNSSLPRTINGLVYGLGNLFFAGKGDMIQVEKIVQDVCEHSFGLKSIFTRAMGHRVCECHAQPIVAPELFRANDTTPLWDIEYSSADPLIKAREYEADVLTLFRQWESLGVWMGGFFEEVSLRFDAARIDLTQTQEMTTVGRLKVKLETVQDNAEELMGMLNHVELWLRK